MTRAPLVLVLACGGLVACSASVTPDLTRLHDGGDTDATSSGTDSGGGTDTGVGVDMGATPVDGGRDAGPIIPFDAGPPRNVMCTSSGGDCTCNTGDRCVMACPAGGCTIVCRTGSTCEVQCPTGDCRVTCETASTCSVNCGGAGGCQTQCGRAASCNVMCTMGCQLSCDTLLMCSQMCEHPSSCGVSGG